MRTHFTRSGQLDCRKSTSTYSTFCFAILLLCGSAAMADVAVRTPGASSTVTTGTSIVVHWTNDLEATLVDVELWDGMRQSSTVIASGVPAQQREFAWTIPTTLNEGSRYRIVIRDAEQRSRTIHSVGFMTLRKQSLMPTSVEAYSSDPTELNVAPMPAAEKIRLTWIEPMKHIEIVDLQGTILRRMEPADGASGCVLNVTDMGTGSYSIVGHTRAGGMIRRPFIVQR
ncbi:MAG: GPI anchored serine-threonine rich family protein [Candidatus Kapaibacterium sp.]